MAAWRLAADWDCSDCAEVPGLKEERGCNGLPFDHPGWDFGHPERTARIRRCARSYLEDAADVVALMRAGSLADWRLSLTEQDTLPVRFLDAWALASNEVSDSALARAKDEGSSD